MSNLFIEERIVGNGIAFECSGYAPSVEAERAAFIQALPMLTNASKEVSQISRPTVSLSEDRVTTTSTDTTECALSLVSKTDTTLEQVLANIKSGKLDMHMGDVIKFKLNDGTDVTFEVTDSDDSSIRFEMKELLKCMPHTELDDYYTELFKLLPEALQKCIIPTTRKYLEKGNGELREKECMLFCPSASEVFEKDRCYGDVGVYEQMEFYKDWRNRVRCTVEDGEPNAWWLLSACSGDSTAFAYVSYYGNADYASATATNVAAPVCFRISKS